MLAGSFVVDTANAGRRVDGVVRKLCAEVPLGVVMKWLRTGRVRVNGGRVKPATRLSAGDTIALPTRSLSGLARDSHMSEPAVPAAPRRRKLPKPEVLYEDDDIMVVVKPGTLACHAGTGHEDDSLAARIVRYLGAENAAVGHRPGLAQRLDGNVSGLLPVGKHAAALRALAEQVSQGGLRKTYFALVDGVLKGDEGVIDVPLRVDDQPMGNRPRTFPDPVNGKPAYTQWRVARRFNDATLLHVRIRTGRTHQIRAHLKSIGHPILGDPRYGPTARNEKLHATYGLGRPFLHAGIVAFTHPITHVPLRCEAPLPPELLRVLGHLKQSLN